MSTTAAPVSSFDIRISQKEGFLFQVDFDNANHDPLFLDEPAPLGKDEAPNAARALAAAIGNCLGASLVFCLQKKGVKATGIVTKVHVDIVRNDHKRLRIGAVSVDLEVPPGLDPAALEACKSSFEDFCTVTQSIRDGIDVKVAVHA